MAESGFWKMTKDGLGTDALYVWYAADSVISDHNDYHTDVKSPMRCFLLSINREHSANRKAVQDSIGIKPSGCAVNCSQDADTSRRKPTTKTVDGVNRVTFLRHMKDSTCLNRCISNVAEAFTSSSPMYNIKRFMQVFFSCLDRRKFGTLSKPKIGLVVSLLSHRLFSAHTSH